MKWNILELPPYSLGVNPVQNTKATLKKRLRKPAFTWKNGEKNYEFWDEIDDETVRDLNNSFQGRLKKVESNKGANIRY